MSMCLSSRAGRPMSLIVPAVLTGLRWLLFAR
jgi:hypothetical protein